MDRIVLGQHANASIGAGLYVSKPGANVMHPEFAIAGNLTFDTNEHSSLHIIQTGTFKITCSRKAISARGETVGNRPNDVSEIFYDDATNDIAAHTFDEDTGRPSNMTTVANWDEAKNLGYLHKPAVGRQSRGKQTNYLDTGSKSITITSPLSGGEIPQVALNFAVGNSSGHFHPWYADVTTTGGGMDWDEWSYNDSTKIVHMDSSWMRLKWGGLGAEEYMGIQDEYYPLDQTNRRTYHDSLVAFFEGDADAAAANMGFSSSIDMENKLKNSKLLSSAINNSQGIVGLIPTVNSTTLTVDAYMTPTHAGLRQPVDRTYEKNKGRQKGVGFNAIDDYADINFSIDFLASQHPDHSESRALIGDITDTIISETINAKKFKHLPGIPTQGDIFRADGGDFDYEDHGKRDMYGWGGHPTEFFVNPFSNGNCTFYTHMQPPHFTDRIYGTNTAAPETTTNYGTYHQAWVGTYLPIGYEGEGKTSWFESVGGSYPGFSPFHTTWGPLISEQLGGPRRGGASRSILGKYICGRVGCGNTGSKCRHGLFSQHIPEWHGRYYLLYV